MYDITTVEQKAALVTAGWKPKDAGTYEAWEKGDFTVALYGDDVRNIGHKRQKDVPLSVAVEVAAILGIVPAGHVLVPEQVAHRGGLAANTAAKFLRTNQEAANGGGDANAAFIAGHQAKALEDLIDAIDPDIRKGNSEPTDGETRTT